MSDSRNAIWVFGFGSLVHTPGFKYEKRVEGFIRGWRRVWWQGSTDHRGTPQRPGRVVTLVADEEAITWGAAFQLAGTPAEQRATLEYLEWREKQYDLRERVDVYDAAGNVPVVSGALCYIATADSASNPNYLGPSSLESIAMQIALSKGPSGWNYEYVYKLAHALREMGAIDEDVFTLEALVRTRRQQIELDGLKDDELKDAEDAGAAEVCHS